MAKKQNPIELYTQNCEYSDFTIGTNLGIRSSNEQILIIKDITCMTISNCHHGESRSRHIGQSVFCRFEKLLTSVSNYSVRQ